VCREAACIERAARRGGLARSFRRPVTLGDELAAVILDTRPAPATPNRVFPHNLLESIC
jgi:hypothetical protein